MHLKKLTLILLAATCTLLISGATDAIQPPPEPAKLSNKERSALIAIYESLVEDSKPLAVGASEEELYNRMGPPDGTMTIGHRKRLSYGSGSVIVADGKIIQINNVSPEMLSTPNREAYEDYQMAMGKVHYMGEWMTKAEADDSYSKALQDKQLTQERIKIGKSAKADRTKTIAISKTSYFIFKQNGATINLSDMLAPGRITIVDFYADWCSPCKAIDPYLRGFANDEDIAVRKVDIVNWGSPVARQWDLKSIPNMRVYDRNGKLVGEPTHDIREIQRFIRRAKRS